MTVELTWNADDVIRTIHGHSLHEQTWVAHGVSIDSRTVRPGDLFIALKDPEQDGHEHVATAFAAGAVAAIVSRQPQVAAEASLITVPDTFEALESLGQAGRQRSQGRIVAVTGSADKISAREMLRLMLNEVGDTYANEGSLDNRWSVPLAMARLPETALYGIFEIGMNNEGQLAPLSQQIRPDVALIAATEATYQEFFLSADALADAKGEIFRSMKHEGIVVLNHDNPQFARLAAIAKARGLKRILSFGRDVRADARILRYTEKPDGNIVEADIFGRRIQYNLGAAGKHIALNSLGALCAAVVAGGDLYACAAVLAHYRQASQREVIQTVRLPNGEFTLIHESNDGDAASIRFAIRVLGQMMPDRGGQRILVLGDDSPASHVDLVPDIVEAKITSVFTCGPGMAQMYETLPPALRGFHAHSSFELAPYVAEAINPGDVVTMKGCHNAGLEIIVDGLKTLGDDGWKARQLAG